jgi:hypothetical protein
MRQPHSGAKSRKTVVVKSRGGNRLFVNFTALWLQATYDGRAKERHELVDTYKSPAGIHAPTMR